jgi:DNA topoisomerase-1
MPNTLRDTGEKTWADGIVWEMKVSSDVFVHFTTQDRAEQIIASKKLMMRPPHEKFGGDAIYAVSAVWGDFVPKVQTTHTKGGPLVAIVFKTSTKPDYGHPEEVVWHRDVSLKSPKIVPVSRGVSMLRGAKTIADDDQVRYANALAAEERVSLLHSLRVIEAAKFQDKKEVPKAEGSGTTTVYEYSEGQVEHRHREKAKRIEDLRKNIGSLRTQYGKDLSAKDPDTRLTALGVALIDVTCERPGNEESADERGHFGITTLQTRHISFKGSKATLSYTGKSGVKHNKDIDEAPVVKALKAAVKGKKSEDLVLCEGEDCTIKASDLNSYLKPFEVTAKDIRGMRANEEMKARLKTLRSKGPALPAGRKEKDEILKKEFAQALKDTAKVVGHEEATLKGEYLVPNLESSYMHDGTVIDKLYEKSAEEREAGLMRWLRGLLSKSTVVKAVFDWGVDELKGSPSAIRSSTPRGYVYQVNKSWYSTLGDGLKVGKHTSETAAIHAVRWQVARTAGWKKAPGRQNPRVVKHFKKYIISFDHPTKSDYVWTSKGQLKPGYKIPKLMEFSSESQAAAVIQREVLDYIVDWMHHSFEPHIKGWAQVDKTADLNPSLGWPGGPCHVVERIENEVRNPRLKDQLQDKVEDGDKLTNPEANKIYRMDKERGTKIKFLQSIVITPHAQYRMDQRNITVNDLRLSLGNFGKAFYDSKSKGDWEFQKWSEDMAYGKEIVWEDSKHAKLVIVFKADGRGNVLIITTYWAGKSDPRPTGTCEVRVAMRWLMATEEKTAASEKTELEKALRVAFPSLEDPDWVAGDMIDEVMGEMTHLVEKGIKKLESSDRLRKFKFSGGKNAWNSRPWTDGSEGDEWHMHIELDYPSKASWAVKVSVRLDKLILGVIKTAIRGTKLDLREVWKVWKKAMGRSEAGLWAKAVKDVEVESQETLHRIENNRDMFGVLWQVWWKQTHSSVDWEDEAPVVEFPYEWKADETWHLDRSIKPSSDGFEIAYNANIFVEIDL